ncbi:MAG: thiamine pyrophosphate-dependent dehydrogenase E1 component subunit alpha [Acidothermus sp.]|nr:thiamine pyrophosphate-dependent dehydrogenase E1 component subunit alpha [Acidothermus sp.]
MLLPTDLGLPSRPAFKGEINGHELALFELMVRLRLFERRAYDLFLQGLVKGTSHLSLGQEAVAAGFARAMEPTDLTFATYRGHAHTLARGVPMSAVMGELMGRATGLMAGKGGSMHLTSVEHGMMGSYAIVGAHLPVAVGAAWAARSRGTKQVVVCFFGDGTTNIGAFHEALSLASVWRVPVVFVCENNLYMEYTAISAVTPVRHPLADRASAYGLSATMVDGNDVAEVFDVARRSLAECREGGGPVLIEALTYRQSGHSRTDPGTYRPKEEVEAWLARDPLACYADYLVSSGFSRAELDEIEAKATAEVDGAVEAARSAPPPEISLVETNLWADGSASWRS